MSTPSSNRIRIVRNPGATRTARRSTTSTPSTDVTDPQQIQTPVHQSANTNPPPNLTRGPSARTNIQREASTSNLNTTASTRNLHSSSSSAPRAKKKATEEEDSGLFGWLGKKIIPSSSSSDDEDAVNDRKAVSSSQRRLVPPPRAPSTRTLTPSPQQQQQQQQQQQPLTSSPSSNQPSPQPFQQQRQQPSPPSTQPQPSWRKEENRPPPVITSSHESKDASSFQSPSPLSSNPTNNSSNSDSSSSDSSDDESDESSSSSEEEESKNDDTLPTALNDQLLRKEVLPLPTVEATMRMMARGDYFTFYYINDGPNNRGGVSLSVHNHRRISTFDMAAMEKTDRSRARQRDDDEEDDDPSSNDTGVNPFFVPQPHNRPVLQKDIFIWVEFPNGLAGKFPADITSEKGKDAKGKVTKALRLSAINGGPQEKYVINNQNYITFLDGATVWWCEAQKPPLPPKGTPPYNGPPEENPYPTHMPHPRKFKTKYREALSHRHQQRIKKEEQKLSVLDILDLYTGKKSFAFLSNQLANVPQECCFTLASKDTSLSFSTENSHVYRLKPYEKPPSKKRREAEEKLDTKGKAALKEKQAKKLKSIHLAASFRQRDAWLLGFASLLSVGRNLVKHRIERVALGDKVLKVARAKSRKRLKLALQQPKTQGALLVRDAASILKSGTYAKRYYVESHNTNDVTDQQQEKTRTRKKTMDGLPPDDQIDPEIHNHLDSVRRILHYEEVFVWAEFPNDPEVKELPDSVQRDDFNLTTATRAQRGGMAGDEDEELDMYGAAFYWCDPNDASLKPRNPSQAVFFSQLEDIYIGKKTEAFVFDHVDHHVCLSLYTPSVVLDLQMENEGFRNLWVKSILALLQLHRVIGAKKENDADNSLLQLPQHLTRDRKASQPGLTPVWLHRRTMSRDSLYGSFSMGSGDAIGSNGFSPRSPLWQPMTPLMLPSPIGARKASDNDLSPPMHIRKTSDLDLGRPMFGSNRKMSDVTGSEAPIIEEEEHEEEKEAEE